MSGERILICSAPLQSSGFSCPWSSHMRFFRRWTWFKRCASLRSLPTASRRSFLKLEALEDRTLPSADPLFGQFQSAGGLLSFHGNSADVQVSSDLSGFVQVKVGD